MQPELFTIGHSTHSLEEFLALLARHDIEALADIRRFPGSRKYPHFNADQLGPALQRVGIEYRWLEALGGRRGKQRDASDGVLRNGGLRNESFRNYADYMASEEFQAGLEQLLELARQKRTAYMCSEGLFWRCHRRLVSDLLLARGYSVQHIMPAGKLQGHALTQEARVDDAAVSYPPADADQSRLF